MQIKCSKCQKIFEIVESKLPKDKLKAMVKCPGCQQILVFNIPTSAPIAKLNEDRTIIEQIKRKDLHPRLIRLIDNAEYPLVKGQNIIGRKAGLIIPDDRYISQKHCMIEVLEQFGELQCIITDDGSICDTKEPSTNGTFHNGKRLTSYDKIFLSNGDNLRIGHTELVFKTEQ
ncbi:MAG: FHA domain-containing protein [Lentimicrobium sp.]|jgi:predicted Zn finger-like uncharacterized protein|nr:FHA domain-containing protein [Lentimicrobium sp.]